MTDRNAGTPVRPAVPLRLDSAVLARRNSEASPRISPSLSSSGASRINTPSTSVPSTPVIPARPPSPERRAIHPGDTNGFLTALAAQERRVLELKEELHKAESDLEKLKKQWAAHESLKKRNEARQMEQMRPLKSQRPEMSPIGEDGSSQGNGALDRRKTLSSSTRSSTRKVFSGSRHARTLSLLSTKTVGSDTSSTTGTETAEHDDRKSLDTMSTHSSATENDISIPIRTGRESMKSPDRDAILETGKQLVGDFKQGFWTFVEDLKQVTVGDEQSAMQQPRPSPKAHVGAAINEDGRVKDLQQDRHKQTSSKIPVDKKTGTFGQPSPHQKQATGKTVQRASNQSDHALAEVEAGSDSENES